MLKVNNIFKKMSALAWIKQYLKGTIIILWVLIKASLFSGVNSIYSCNNKQQFIQKPVITK